MLTCHELRPYTTQGIPAWLRLCTQEQEERRVQNGLPLWGCGQEQERPMGQQGRDAPALFLGCANVPYNRIADPGLGTAARPELVLKLGVQQVEKAGRGAPSLRVISAIDMDAAHIVIMLVTLEIRAAFEVARQDMPITFHAAGREPLLHTGIIAIQGTP